MRKLLFVALLLAAIPVMATPAFVRGSYGANPTFSLGFSSNTAGDTLVVMAECSNGGSPCYTGVTDTVGNKYRLTTIQPSTSSWILYIWVAENCLVSAGTNTVSFTSSSGNNRMAIAEYSGVSSVRSLRSIGYGFGASATTLAITNTMPTVAGDLVVSFGFTLSGSITTGAGCTSRATTDGFAMFEDKIAAGTSDTCAFTSTSADWTIVSVVLSPSAVAPDTNRVRWNDNGGLGLTSLTVALPSNTSGNMMVAGFALCCASFPSPTITDTAGNTWQILKVGQGGSGVTSFLAYAPNIATSAGVNTVTFAWGGSARNVYGSVGEYSNVSATPLRYTSCSGLGCNSSNATGTVTSGGVAATNDLIVGFTYNLSSTWMFSPPTGYNQVNGPTPYRIGVMYDNLGAGGSSLPVPLPSGIGNSSYFASFKTNSSSAFSFVQGRSCNQGTTSTTCKFPNSLTSGNEIIIGVAADGASQCLSGWISDTLSTTYTLESSTFCAGCHTGRTSCIFHAAVPSASADTITVTAASGEVLVGIMEASGYSNTVTATSSTNNTAPPVLPTVTVPANNSLMFCVGDGDVITTMTPADASLFLRTIGWGYKAVSAGAGQNCSFDNGSVGSLAIFGPLTVSTVHHRVVNY